MFFLALWHQHDVFARLELVGKLTRWQQHTFKYEGRLNVQTAACRQQADEITAHDAAEQDALADTTDADSTVAFLLCACIHTFACRSWSNVNAMRHVNIRLCQVLTQQK